MIFLVSTFVATAMMIASELPMPPIPNFLEKCIARVITIILPGNVHGQEEMYEFSAFWLTSLIVLLTLYIIGIILIKLIKHHSTIKNGPF